MKIKTQRVVGKKTLIAVIVTVLVICTIVYYAFQNRHWPFDGIFSAETSTTDSSGYKNHDPNFDINSVDPIDKTPTQYEDDGKTTSETGSLSGVINYKSVVDNNLVIRVTISDSLSDGTCKLSLTNKSAETLTRLAAIIRNPSSSTCDGFTIPVQDLDKGTWDITIMLESGGKSGKISGKVII